MNLDEVDARRCWRCGSECDTDLIDVSTYGDREPRMVEGATRCSNDRCPNRYAIAAHFAPSPDELVEQGRACVDRVQAITLEAVGARRGI